MITSVNRRAKLTPLRVNFARRFTGLSLRFRTALVPRLLHYGLLISGEG